VKIGAQLEKSVFHKEAQEINNKTYDSINEPSNKEADHMPTVNVITTEDDKEHLHVENPKGFYLINVIKDTNTKDDHLNIVPSLVEVHLESPGKV